MAELVEKSYNVPMKLSEDTDIAERMLYAYFDISHELAQAEI